MHVWISQHYYGLKCSPFTITVAVLLMTQLTKHLIEMWINNRDKGFKGHTYDYKTDDKDGSTADDIAIHFKYGKLVA